MDCHSYHSRRAYDELRLSRDARDVSVAKVHRQLGLMHAGKLMASAFANDRHEAQQLFDMLGGDPPVLRSNHRPPHAGSLKVRRSRLTLRFG